MNAPMSESKPGRFFTGLPCRRGHIAERLISTRNCVECRRLARGSEKALSQQRARRAVNGGEDPQRVRERANAWQKANPAKKRINQRAYYERNKERIALYDAQRYKKQPERFNAANANRRARLLAAEGTHSPSDINLIFRLQKGKCAYCAVKLKRPGFHVDHIIPLVLGGSNQATNLQITCKTCNLTKGRSDPIDFARVRGMLL